MAEGGVDIGIKGARFEAPRRIGKTEVARVPRTTITPEVSKSRKAIEATQILDIQNRMRELARENPLPSREQPKSEFDAFYQKMKDQRKSNQLFQQNWYIERTLAEDLTVREEALREAQTQIAADPNMNTRTMREVVDEAGRRASARFIYENQERAVRIISNDRGKTWLDAQGIEAGKVSESMILGSSSLSREVDSGQPGAKESQIVSAMGDIRKASADAFREMWKGVKKMVKSQQDEEEKISAREREEQEQEAFRRNMTLLLVKISLEKEQQSAAASRATSV